MKTLFQMLSMAGIGLVLLFGSVQARVRGAQEPTKIDPTGTWQGALDVNSIKLRLVFKVSKTENGALKATMDSIDQGAKDIPVDSVTVADKTVTFELKPIGGVFEGTFNADGTEINGTWKQGAASLPLVLKRSDKPIVLNRPQEPKPKFPYETEDVTYENKAAGVTLAGTLTKPFDKGPFPVVLLISGSGPQDRDEFLLGHRPFLVLADYLTRRGVAVLRVDDRGIGKSTGNFVSATSEDFASDVSAGVEFLKSRKDINPKLIGLAGHSEGGLIAPMVAAKSSDVAFIVLLAGPGLPGDEILYAQGALIAKAAGASDDTIAKGQANQKQIFTVVKAEKDPKVAEQKLLEQAKRDLANLTDEEKKKGVPSEQQILAEIRQVNSPWFRFFLTHDPRPTLKQVKCPVLALNGEKDLQVPAKENLDAIERALKEGGNKRFKTLMMPGLNHLFQTSTTGSPSEYGQIEETFAPAALKEIGDWIDLQIARKK